MAQASISEEMRVSMPMAKIGAAARVVGQHHGRRAAQLQRQLAGQLFIGHAAHAVGSKQSVPYYSPPPLGARLRARCF